MRFWQCWDDNSHGRQTFAKSVIGAKRTNRLPPSLSASLIGRLGSSAFRLSTSAVLSLSRARASLRNRHQGRSIMGSEDEAEQSIQRPSRQATAGSSMP